MIIRNTVIIALMSIGLFSCSEKSEPTKEETGEVLNEDEEQAETILEELLQEEKSPTVLSFTNKSIFKIVTKNAGENTNTGTDNIDVFLNNKLLKEPIKLSRDLGHSEVTPGTNGVPQNAVFAYSTWFAGGGEVYYGIVKDGVLQINRKFEDEAMEEEAQFTLFREIDPNVQTSNPDYYISYDSDDKSSKELMIAFTQDGKALFAKYFGQSRQLELKLVKDEIQDRSIIGYYNEIVNGEVTGTYKLTHTGNWDNVEYTVKKTGKKFDFTINHEVTIVGDSYRKDPSL